MLPSLNLRQQLGKLLAADPTTLAPAALANKIALIKAAFTPTENLVIGDLMLADFATSTPLSAGVGTQSEGIDPQTGDDIITLLAPLGGWRWETTALTNLPQTIYGFTLLDNALAVVLGVALLPTPVTLTIVNQVINLGEISFRINVSPFN